MSCSGDKATVIPLILTETFFAVYGLTKQMCILQLQVPVYA